MTASTPARRPRGRITKRDRETFLEALAAGWTVTHAAGLAGRSRQRFYDLAHGDPDFAAAWQDAWEAGTEVIVDEVRRRAIDGWDEPVYQGGELVGHIRRKSDRLLEFYASMRTGYGKGALVQVNVGLEMEQVENPTSIRDVLELLQRQGSSLPPGIELVDVGDGEAVELPALPPGEAA